MVKILGPTPLNLFPMGAEIKSSTHVIRTEVSKSLKNAVKRAARDDKKSVAQWLRDLIQANLKDEPAKEKKIK